MLCVCVCVYWNCVLAVTLKENVASDYKNVVDLIYFYYLNIHENLIFYQYCYRVFLQIDILLTSQKVKESSFGWQGYILNLFRSCTFNFYI